MSAQVIDGYCADAENLIPRYRAVSSEILFAPVSAFLPQAPAQVLDVGAGTGRDAIWLSGCGHHVVAVEPVVAFRDAAAACPHHGVEWIDDRLPDLVHVSQRQRRFDFILLSAVWHHLTEAERKTALPVLGRLLARSATLILSLRSGQGVASRPAYPTTAKDVVDMARVTGLRHLATVPASSVQEANKSANISWDWLVFAPQESPA
ncbi:MAG: class I SAM-dependent methyltransferase [Sulfitobacter sp.]